MTAGALMVMLGGLCLGICGAAELRARARATESALLGLRALEREICGRLTPLSEAAKNAAASAGTPLMGVFAAELEQRGGEHAAECWAFAAASAGLSSRARQIIAPLGPVLGRYDAEEQRKAFTDTIARLAETSGEEREKSRTLGRVSVAMGAGGGLLVVILLL